MPAAEFSEYSYGYAVVRHAENLLAAKGSPIKDAPELPSLLTENVVGYDAKLVTVDFALFLQFKRSFFVSRQHPQGACGIMSTGPHCTWAHWESPHYRFDVDTSSDQFVIMRGYETDINLGYRSGLALYVAPAFHHQSEFSDAYARGSVLEQSVGVRPSAFDGVSAGAHHFSFDPAMTGAAILSDPVTTVAKSTAEQVTTEVELQVSLRRPRHEKMTLAGLAEWAISQQRESLPPMEFDPNSGPQALAYLKEFAGLLGGAFVLLGQAHNIDG